MDNNKFIYNNENEFELIDTQCKLCEFYNEEKINVSFIKKVFLKML